MTEELNHKEIYNTHYAEAKFFEVDSVETYVSYIMKLSESGSELAFRGEHDLFNETLASVFRKDRPKILPDTLKKKYYKEIAHSLTDIERENFMSYSRHHGLPTELLDMTRLPLYALYFACSERNISNLGVVQVFNVAETMRLSDFETDNSYKYQIFDISQAVFNYYHHAAGEKFISRFTSFLKQHPDYTKRLLGETAIYLADTFRWVEPQKLEALSLRERQIIQLLKVADVRNVQRGSAFSVSQLIIQMVNGNGQVDNPELEKIRCTYLKSESTQSQILILTYMELLGLAFEVLDFVLDTDAKGITLPPFPVIRYSPTAKFDRMRAQEGEFIYQLYMIRHTEANIRLIPQKINSNIRFIIRDKSKIRKQLNTLGVNRKLIYPDADNIARYLTEWEF